MWQNSLYFLKWTLKEQLLFIWFKMTRVLLTISGSCKVGNHICSENWSCNFELCCKLYHIMQSCVRGRMIIASLIKCESIIWGTSSIHMVSPLLRAPMVIVHRSKVRGKKKNILSVLKTDTGWMCTQKGRERICWKQCTRKLFRNYSPRCIVCKIADREPYYGHREDSVEGRSRCSDSKW